MEYIRLLYTCGAYNRQAQRAVVGTTIANIALCPVMRVSCRQIEQCIDIQV